MIYGLKQQLWADPPLLTAHIFSFPGSRLPSIKNIGLMDNSKKNCL